ncbi:MAG TPA: hypothetical protein VME86_12705 [Acidobacteriaceae bacterium]|nr:hypothetical protein [Acidobacteriaceae bacterium]
MLRRLSLLSLSLLVFTACAWTQRGPNIFVTPIPNAPFSGTVEVQRSIVQDDGHILAMKTTRMIARDQSGDIYNEMRMLVSPSYPRMPQLLRIHLYYPKTRITVMLDPTTKTYWANAVNRPPATEPPGLFFAAPTGSDLPPSQYSDRVDLGSRKMDGLEVHGVRITQTIPPSITGTGKPIVITDEYWYSYDLRMNLRIVHNDPRTGSVTMQVTDLSLQPPDPAVFQIPSDYRLAGAQQGTGKSQ